ARSTSSKASSYRYQVTGITNVTTTHGLGEDWKTTMEWTEEGAYSSPHRLWTRHTVTATVAEGGWPEGDTHTSESVHIGSRCYQRTDGETHWTVDDDWGEAEGLFGEGSSLLLNIDSLMDVERLPNETIRGIDCLHYRGKVDMDAYVDKLPDYLYPDERYREWLGYSDTTVELWIGEDDYVIRKYQTDERNPYGMANTEELSTPAGPEARHVGTEVAEFYDYNEPVDIEPPL
ncbi:unnamed protein product, partial [marine sediment metagenome]